MRDTLVVLFVMVVTLAMSPTIIILGIALGIFLVPILVISITCTLVYLGIKKGVIDQIKPQETKPVRITRKIDIAQGPGPGAYIISGILTLLVMVVIGIMMLCWIPMLVIALLTGSF